MHLAWRRVLYIYPTNQCHSNVLGMSAYGIHGKRSILATTCPVALTNLIGHDSIRLLRLGGSEGTKSSGQLTPTQY